MGESFAERTLVVVVTNQAVGTAACEGYQGRRDRGPCGRRFWAAGPTKYADTPRRARLERKPGRFPMSVSGLPWPPQASLRCWRPAALAIWPWARKGLVNGTSAQSTALAVPRPTAGCPGDHQTNHKYTKIGVIGARLSLR